MNEDNLIKIDQDLPQAPPPGALVCANCFWAIKHPQGPNFECYADPPKLMQIARPSLVPRMPPDIQIVSMRPAVQPHHCCRHFLVRNAEGL